MRGRAFADRMRRERRKACDTSAPRIAVNVGKAGVGPVAEARGHLVLNNVALALEGFRKAQRDEPESTDALLGIATCYDRMGRFRAFAALL